MGLTRGSTGLAAVDNGLTIRRLGEGDRVFALAGNPNVGKSTVFNALTGMNQHTGNWPGKTVATAQGRCIRHGTGIILVDLPGTYSLLAHSAEEEAARDFLCFGGGDGAVVVCDATCLERNLNLVLQVLEITPRTVVCVNLLDEAARKGIHVDLEGLERALGVPVVGTTARSGRGLEELLLRLGQLPRQRGQPLRVVYPRVIEDGVSLLLPALRPVAGEKLDCRWLALRLLEEDQSLDRSLAAFLGEDIRQREEVAEAITAARQLLAQQGWGRRELEEAMVAAIVATAESVASGTVYTSREDTGTADRRLDRIFASRRAGIPVMLLLLLGVFWLTIVGANYPSQLLSTGLFWLGDRIGETLAAWGCPPWLLGLLIDGAYRVLAWVVAVMLPPMAIFFPLFTLLEDLGYLPRVAFNLDRCFQRARACGKQSLTMCMGFGCNAAGIVGCRIIDSPRERLIAILTNSFVPCNGRFPTLILLITIFFTGTGEGFRASLLSALGLTGVILLGVGATLLASRLLSATVLRGVPSAFALELPLPQAPGGPGAGAVGAGPDPLCPGAGGGGGGSGGAGDLGHGQHHGGGRHPAPLLRRPAGPLGPAAGDGRRHPAGLYPGVPRQRDRHPHHRHDLPFRRDPPGTGQHRPTPRPAGAERLDLGHRRVGDPLLPDALALLHHLPYHLPGDQEPPLDRPLGAAAHRGGDAPLHPFHRPGPGAGPGVAPGGGRPGGRRGPAGPWPPATGTVPPLSGRAPPRPGRTGA